MLIANHQMTESQLMAEASRALKQRLLEAPAIREALTAPEPPPKHYTPEQQARRTRSLRQCHLPSLYTRPRYPRPKDTGAYVPACAARLDNDPNLTDGARRCARKIMEETHRRDRKERALQVNVSYLAKGLRRCRRTIQRYLAMLEREGYIRVEVMSGRKSRMCIGLIVHLLSPLFPRHAQSAWAEKCGTPPKHLADDAETRRNPDATFESQNESHTLPRGETTDPLLGRYPYLNSYHPRFRALHEPRCQVYTRETWGRKCQDGIFRALIKALPRPWLVAGLHQPEDEAWPQAR